mmetsp:Transcript_30547/g.65411  ORF Transcript_30547/g.65411 Transcript_30547/m.65411 type:complete len:146 (-) Transcript_30547:108-545(-)
MGQDFKLNHMPKDIDFATIHIWPDTWERPEESFQRSWILTHMREAEEELGKPLVLEEFGKSIKSYEDGIEARNQVYRSAHELVEESVRKNRGLKGSCFWNWETDLIRSPGSYEINNGDSTFELVKEHARRMNEMSAQKCSFRCEV